MTCLKQGHLSRRLFQCLSLKFPDLEKRFLINPLNPFLVTFCIRSHINFANVESSFTYPSSRNLILPSLESPPFLFISLPSSLLPILHFDEQ